MDVLKAEIERKRKLLEDKKLVVCIKKENKRDHLMLCNNTNFKYINLILAFFFCYQIENHPQSVNHKNKQSDKKKFFRRGDLLQQEKDTYLAQQGKQNENASKPEKSSDSREYRLICD